ncbi:glycoside hydrolase family 65 protein [Thermithiobacillus plumbiphilus]|uniref:Glycosyl hydrolase family 65 protein n=1 Tax=Thermithiobacillus plumbiphilus TaxID=1729899 RepID=A0ABU9DDA3_9PROT
MNQHASSVTSPLGSFTPTADPEWRLVEEGFNLAREHEIESIFAIGNGYLGSRASLAEGSNLSAPATLIAGVFDHDPVSNVPDLALAPDWMQVQASMEHAPIRVDLEGSLLHRRILDLRQGIFWREWRFRDAGGRTSRILGLRLASLADRHVLLQSVLLVSEDHGGHLHLDARIRLPPARPGRVVLNAESTRQDIRGRMIELATHAGLRVALAVRNHIRSDAGTLAPDGQDHWDLQVEPGRQYRFDRLVVVHTSRDGPDPAASASAHLQSLPDTDQLIAAHVAAWAARWEQADVQVKGDGDAQRALRFAIYHLISSANPEDERVSIGARALTGDAYKGHVFWDTEIFMLPFFIFTHPPSARALLMYRYHTLPAARAKAHKLGYRGALYAWESADSGEETTPSVTLMPDGRLARVLSGEQEHHISADVAYAVWQYWQATGDADFLLRAGAEILLETARFWASRGQLEADGRYHIRHVIGPDEYHEDIDDNAYTNLMAQWNLRRGAELAGLLAEHWPAAWQELARRLEFDMDEPRQWQDLAGRIHVGLDASTGVLEQFQEFFGLEAIDLPAYEPRAVPMDVILGHDRTQAAQVVKQADVVMLMALLWEQLSPSQRAANYRYYAPKTGHGSSLSPAMHALVAARLGIMDEALAFFRQSAEIDLSNHMGNAAGGVHAAALGGLWQAAVLGFAGMRLLSDGLAFEPHLPPDWDSLTCRVLWHGQALQLRLETDCLILSVEGQQSVPVRVGGTARWDLSPGQVYRWRQIEGAWQEMSV